MKLNKIFINAALALTLSAGALNAQDDAAADAAPSCDTCSSLHPILQKMYVGFGVGSAFSYTDVKQYPNGLPIFNYRTELGYGLNGFVGYKFNRW